jgi:hypothetical protein
MIGDWVLHLRERLDHEQRLMPYIISGLSDPHPPNAEAAMELLENLGQLRLKDKEKEMKDPLHYLPEEAHGLGWQVPGVATFVYGKDEFDGGAEGNMRNMS